jgi:hypothetical protein
LTLALLPFPSPFCLVRTNAIRKQIDSFLSGLHDLVPKDLISIFTPAELELLSCGMPEIDRTYHHLHTQAQR